MEWNRKEMQWLPWLSNFINGKQIFDNKTSSFDIWLLRKLSKNLMNIAYFAI